MFSSKIKKILISNNYKRLFREIPLNKAVKREVNGKGILLVKHDDQLFAISEKCPHQGKSLKDGKCEEGHIVCPYHQFAFDLKTGLGCGTGIDTYPLITEGNSIYIEMKVFSLF